MSDPTPEVKEPGHRKADCAQCGGPRNCNIRGEFCERGGDDNFQWQRVWYILECRGCEHVFIQNVGTSSDEVFFSGDEECDYIEHIEYWPALSKRKQPLWMDPFQTTIKGIDDLNDSLYELYMALDHDMNILAAIGVRTTFDIAAVLLDIDPDRTFKEKLIELEAKGHVKLLDIPQLEFLVEAGHASAHRRWKPTAGDLVVLMNVLEHFIHEAFWAPELRRRLKAGAEETSAKVPARKPRAKSSAKGQNGTLVT